MASFQKRLSQPSGRRHRRYDDFFGKSLSFLGFLSLELVHLI
jgi:hypothetical protein